MEIGLALPHYDFSVPGENPLSWETLLGYARDAEAQGFDAVYVSDHLVFDVAKYGGGPDEYGTFEALVTLAALGREVPRVRLGTLVLCEVLRSPGVLAKTLASLDRIVGGRLDVGLGAGWYTPDYEMLGMDVPGAGERVTRLGETLDIVTGVIGGGPYSYEGRFHSVRSAVAKPPSLQTPRPRVFVGAKGDRMIRLAAQRADGWNTVWVWEPEAYAERLRVFERACEEVGRDPARAWRTLGLYTLVGEDEADLAARYRRMQEQAPGGMLDGVGLDEWRAGRLVGTVDEVRAQLRDWKELGVHQLVACVGPLPFAVSHPEDVALAAHALTGAV